MSATRQASLARLAPLLAILLVPAAAAQGPAVTVLLHHPDDGVDPLGLRFGGIDSFAARHAPLADAEGRFAYPFFVADGTIPISGLPDPGRPYDSARQAYGEAVAVRRGEETPVTMRLTSVLADGLITVTATVQAVAAVGGEDLRLWFALAEDPVSYTPPSGLTNGVTQHRFTVRALHDAGELGLENGAETRQWTLGLGSWNRDNLLAAAWVQQGAPSGRFDAREAVQATHAALGDAVDQTAKGVLVEVLSATWCDPCLYGDLAAEDLAVSLGSAQPLEMPRTRYFEAPSNALLTVVLSLAFGIAVALSGRRLGGGDRP